MPNPRRAWGVATFLAAFAAGCGHPGAGDLREASDTAGEAPAHRSVPHTDALRPEGARFGVSGTHVELCSLNAIGKCPTMWSSDPLQSPNTCGQGGPADVAYVVHQRGTDWNGQDAEEELHGHEYRVAHKALYEVTARHDQSVILQCCPRADGKRFFAIKTCPDPCDGPTCPSTYGEAPFGGCLASGGVTTSSCDVLVAEAGWIDPHAPHDLADPSGEDKRVFDLFYTVDWTCNGDGVCSLGEDCASCPDDCAEDCPAP